MKELISYDTETCGIPDWKIPSDDPSQPHIVQIGAVVVDADTREVKETLNVLIKPDGWEIPEITTELTGITQERALAEGIPETEAVDKLLALCEGRQRIAYNRTFDQRIIRIALKRYNYGEDAMEAWGQKDNHECSMIMAKRVIGRQVKLGEAFKFFTGEEPKESHTALADAETSLAVYWGVLDHKPD